MESPNCNNSVPNIGSPTVEWESNGPLNSPSAWTDRTRKLQKELDSKYFPEELKKKVRVPANSLKYFEPLRVRSPNPLQLTQRFSNSEPNITEKFLTSTPYEQGVHFSPIYRRSETKGFPAWDHSYDTRALSGQTNKWSDTTPSKSTDSQASSANSNNINAQNSIIPCLYNIANSEVDNAHIKEAIIPLILKAADDAPEGFENIDEYRSKIENRVETLLSEIKGSNLSIGGIKNRIDPTLRGLVNTEGALISLINDTITSIKNEEDTSEDEYETSDEVTEILTSITNDKSQRNISQHKINKQKSKVPTCAYSMSSAEPTAVLDTFIDVIKKSRNKEDTLEDKEIAVQKLSLTSALSQNSKFKTSIFQLFLKLLLL